MDFFPCFVKQALECARLSTDDECLQKQVLDTVMSTLIATDYKNSPPDISRTQKLSFLSLLVKLFCIYLISLRYLLKRILPNSVPFLFFFIHHISSFYCF